MQETQKPQQGIFELKIHNAELVLHPYRAVYWPAYRLLIVTDLHLGKIQHFRNSGIYLPSHASMDNYERLSTLLLEFSPKSILILGDLFHSHYNQDWKNFCELRNSFPTIDFELIPGNHDIVDPQLFSKNEIVIHEPGYTIENMHFSHYPEKVDSLYNIAGHIHPGIKLVGDGLQSLKLPVFYFGADQAILPSFGTFTGIALIKPVPGDQVIAITNDELVQIDTSI